MARTYKRDSRGRFASGGGSSGGGRSGGKVRPGQIARATDRANANRKRAVFQGMYGVGTSRNIRRTIYGAQDALKKYASAESSDGRKTTAKPKPAKRSTPKTTTARGRALQNQRRASDLVRAGRGGSGPSKKAVRSAVTAMRARAYYAATGTGTKRSAKKAVSATKKRKQIRTEIGAKAAEARVKSAGKPRAQVVAGKVAAKKPRKVDLSTAAFERRARTTERRARQAEKELAQVDRFNPANKRIRNRAYALRSAADSYASLVRRGSKGEFSAGYLFQSGTKASRRTTAPKLTRSEKAAATRAKNKAAKEAEQRRRWEQSRRR